MLIIPLWTSAYSMVTAHHQARGRYPESFLLGWLDIPQKADICLFHQNQVPVFLVQGRITTCWSLLPVFTKQFHMEAHSVNF